ncbi:MAG: DUF4494 domain-containing protein [Flavobacteriales bacterium]|nr:DUF4494 domain-containing protein [Flavobacteriales bacterium]
MNKHWFTCRVSYRKLDETGHEVKAVSSYLVDAYTYTEAEARIIHLMNSEINGTFEVVNITKNNFAEVIDSDESELWFKVKVALISFDENTGKEKQSNQHFLMCADDVQDAFLKTEEYMKGSVSGFVIPAINYTKIEEVFRETPDEREEMKLRERGFIPMSESSLNVNVATGELAGEVADDSEE